ncbi:purine-cytosine permease family protein [Streptomyces tsukubensis]|uniref:Allantoin permease n=1 Tax=Streptomyces tsukubensis TaxID=83656 RepID=A0A1V4ADS4_9ACTN|nr:cytosine permease [Streptomyces tsukubensis]OON82182.1 allantoin permease [Streptomyces tsukubensis]QFR92669.1 cytosine permease [Streptomyces tsukubensis]
MDASTESARVGTVETRGIEPVPDRERHGRASQLFWTWFAANISLLGLPLGASLVAFRGLNFWQAAIVAVIGSVGSFALVGWLSMSGQRGGAPAMTLSRAVFGQRGNKGPTVITWISRVGWETITTTTAAYALLALASTIFGVHQNTVLTLVALLIFIVCTLLISGLGHATIMWINKWATLLFGVLNLIVIGFLVATVDWAKVLDAQAGPLGGVIGGIGFIAAGTGIGWANAGADYARYLPKSIPGKRLVVASAFGAGIPLVLLISLGSLLTAGDDSLATASDPVAAINAMLPSWMAIPYLIAAFGGLLMSNHLSVYSAGLTMLTLGLKVPRAWAVCIDIIVTFGGGIYFMLIAGDFYGPFTTFLTLLAVPISAWIGVMGVDMVRGRRYNPDALMDTGRTSRYWYTGGFRWAAFGPWIIAIVAGLLFTSASTSDNDVWFKGPLADTWFGTNGLGWAVAIVVGGLLYALFGGRDHDDLAGDTPSPTATTPEEALR